MIVISNTRAAIFWSKVNTIEWRIGAFIASNASYCCIFILQHWMLLLRHHSFILLEYGCHGSEPFSETLFNMTNICFTSFIFK
jgi:hypothetical protein